MTRRSLPHFTPEAQRRVLIERRQVAKGDAIGWTTAVEEEFWSLVAEWQGLVDEDGGDPSVIDDDQVKALWCVARYRAGGAKGAAVKDMAVARRAVPEPIPVSAVGEHGAAVGFLIYDALREKTC